MVLPADFLLKYQNDIDKCARLLKSSCLMPLKTTQLYDYEHLLLVIGADAASGQTPPPTLIIVKNAIKDGEG